MTAYNEITLKSVWLNLKLSGVRVHRLVCWAEETVILGWYPALVSICHFALNYFYFFFDKLLKLDSMRQMPNRCSVTEEKSLNVSTDSFSER